MFFSFSNNSIYDKIIHIRGDYFGYENLVNNNWNSDNNIIDCRPSECYFNKKEKPYGLFRSTRKSE